MTDALKAAGWTALFAFVGLFGPAALGWLEEVVAWAAADGTSAFPDLSVIGSAFVAAAGAAGIAALNFVVRALQAKGKLPGHGPVYETTGREKRGGPDDPFSGHIAATS